MKKLILLSATAFLMSACSSEKEPNIELIQDMMEQPSIKAQEYDAGSPDNRGMRVPPENTVPQGFTPYRYGIDAEKAKDNRNPIAGETSQEVVMAGIKYYETNCMVCHGMNGEGGETNN